MKVMKNLALSLSLALASALLSPAHAVVEVAGVKFDDTYSLAGQTLQLNGAGLRKMMFIKVYTLGLYVQRKETTPQALLNVPGYKSMHVVLKRDVKAQKLIDALVTGVENNTSDEELQVLRPRLEHLANGLRSAGEIEEDTMVKIEFVPGLGTVVSHKDKIVVKDLPGEDFYRALMRIWLGEKPADRSLKAQLLGETD